MVKVLKCHHFRSQKSVPVKAEPVCLASGRGKIFVGTGNSSIDVFSVRKEHGNKDDRWYMFCSFQTGAPVTQIEYNDVGDYVATVERKESRRAEVVSVKVYLNWSIANTHRNYRTRVRVASLGYRSTKVNVDEQRLEVVDVPCEKPAQYITTCQETGNLVVASGCKVKLYHLVEKTIPNSDTTFLDIVLFLELSFHTTILRLSLCENYLACSSKDFVQIFQIEMSTDTRPRKPSSTEQLGGTVSPRNRRSSSAVCSSFNLEPSHISPNSLHKKSPKFPSISEQPKFSIVGERGSSTPSPALSSAPKMSTYQIEDDESFVHWRFDTSSSKSTPQGRSGTAIIDSTLHLALLENLGQDNPRDLPMPQLQDHIGGAHSTTGQTTVKEILCKSLDESDHSWIQLQLLPTYLVGKLSKLTVANTSVPVHSGRRASLVGLSCLMSGARVGFMYSLLNGPRLLSKYKYVSDVIQVQSNGYQVFVVTTSGLQTYTSRALISVLCDTQPQDKVKQICPLVCLDICVCGAEKFLGAWDITLVDKHVIILTKIENSWAVYALEDISPAEFYNDIVTFGSRYQHNAPDTYLHLLLEGHLVLQSQLAGLAVSEQDASEINKLLCESCALLGDYYAMPGCSDWHLCLYYYQMSQLSPIEVVRLQYRQKTQASTGRSAGYGMGFVHYLKYVLFQEDDPLDLKSSDYDLLLSICLDTMPEKVSSVILFSRVKSYTPDKAFNILLESIKLSQKEADSKSRTLDQLATVSLNLQLCEPETAVATLSSIDRNDLIEACVTNHHILHTNYTELSPLSQMLRCKCPSVLIKTLVILHDRGTIPLDLAVQLLQGKSGAPELHKNTHVREYLEALLNDDVRKFCFEDAAPLLCEIYIQRMAEWEPPSIRKVTPSMKFRLPSGSGHFGRRHGWLDHMTPFTGAQSINSPCRYLKPACNMIAGPSQWLQCQKSDEVCSCFLCNEELLKLQSLLCSREASKTLCEKVAYLLEKYTLRFFHDSLYLLCLMKTDIHKAISVVTDRHPYLAAQFGSSVIKHNHTQWEALLKSMLAKLEESKQLADQEFTQTHLMTSITETLEALVTWMDPVIFLQILPDKGNFIFFLPYIKLCVENQKSAQLKQQILTLGDQIAKA